MTPTKPEEDLRPGYGAYLSLSICFVTAGAVVYQLVVGKPWEGVIYAGCVSAVALVIGIAMRANDIKVRAAPPIRTLPTRLVDRLPWMALQGAVFIGVLSLFYSTEEGRRRNFGMAPGLLATGAAFVATGVLTIWLECFRALRRWFARRGSTSSPPGLPEGREGPADRIERRLGRPG